jgi:hypothetical protein
MRREFAGAIYDVPNWEDRREEISRRNLKWAAGSLATGSWRKAQKFKKTRVTPAWPASMAISPTTQFLPAITVSPRILSLVSLDK